MLKIANDYGYEYIYSKQLETYGFFDDLLITISCSGTSKNILEAQHAAYHSCIPLYAFETFGKIKDFGKLEDKYLKFAHKVAKAL